MRVKGIEKYLVSLKYAITITEKIIPTIIKASPGIPNISADVELLLSQLERKLLQQNEKLDFLWMFSRQ